MSGWTQKGGTLSAQNACQRYGLTSQEISEGVEKKHLQFRRGSCWGNPYYKLLTHELERYVKLIKGEQCPACLKYIKQATEQESKVTGQESKASEQESKGTEQKSKTTEQESIRVGINRLFHKSCFCCIVCRQQLTIKGYTSTASQLYCATHYEIRKKQQTLLSVQASIKTNAAQIKRLQKSQKSLASQEKELVATLASLNAKDNKKSDSPSSGDEEAKKDGVTSSSSSAAGSKKRERNGSESEDGESESEYEESPPKRKRRRSNHDECSGNVELFYKTRSRLKRDTGANMKNECVKHKLPCYGKKSVLVERLVSHYDEYHADEWRD